MDKRARIKVLLVDDHPLVLEGLRAALESRLELQIVGQAVDGEQALSLVRSEHPDIVLMDISMPRLGGLEATRILKNEAPHTKIVILTMHNKKEYIHELMRAGAEGYVLKDSPPDELLAAIQAVRKNGRFYSPKLSLAVSGAINPAVDQEAAFRLLSQRELEVLRGMAGGLPSKQIADRLNITCSTVGTFRKRIMRKLGINHIAGLTRYALQQGLLERS